VHVLTPVVYAFLAGCHSAWTEDSSFIHVSGNLRIYENMSLICVFIIRIYTCFKLYFCNVRLAWHVLYSFYLRSDLGMY